MAKAMARRSRSLRDTPIRRKVLDLLGSSTVPLSVKSLAAKIKGSDMVTLYRTVDALVAAGKARRVDLGGRAALYESSDRHYHHIVCTSCGKIEDFEGCALGEAEKRILERSRSFESITSHSFELFGVCSSCAPSTP